MPVPESSFATTLAARVRLHAPTDIKLVELERMYTQAVENRMSPRFPPVKGAPRAGREDFGKRTLPTKLLAATHQRSPMRTMATTQRRIFDRAVVDHRARPTILTPRAAAISVPVQSPRSPRQAVTSYRPPPAPRPLPSRLHLPSALLQKAHEAAVQGKDTSAYKVMRPDASDHSGSVARAPKESKRVDPLAPFGLRTLGPIAAGAFSTVVRARRVGVSCRSKSDLMDGEEEEAGASDGVAHEVHEEVHEEVAVKSFHKGKYQKAGWLKTALRNELEVLSALQAENHPHIGNLYDIHEGAQATHAVLQYCSGGSVHRHLRSLRHGSGLAEPAVATMTHQAALGLAHLHALGACHRDVKPENVLYSDASRSAVKLCDFGFAIMCRGRKLRSTCGSPAYMAPELSSHEAYLGPPVDCWALGCFAFEVLHGCPAFRAETIDDLQLRIKRADHKPFAKTISQECRRLVHLLLVPDVSQRQAASDAAAGWLKLRGIAA